MSSIGSSDLGGTKESLSPSIWVLANCPCHHTEFIAKIETLRRRCSNVVGVSVAIDPANLPDSIPHTDWPIHVTLVNEPSIALPDIPIGEKHTKRDIQKNSQRPLCVRKFLKPKQETDAILFIDFSYSKNVDHWIALCQKFKNDCLFVPQEAFTQKMGDHIILAKNLDKGDELYPAYGGDMCCSIYSSQVWHDVEATPCQIIVKVFVEHGGVGSARVLTGVGFGWCLEAQKKNIKIYALIA